MRKTIRQLYSDLRLRLLLLVLLACAPLVGLILHTASEEHRRQVKEWNQLTQAMMAGQRAVDLASARYNRGLTDFLNVVDAERQFYELQEQYAGWLARRANC